jgi:rhodopsin domain-containing protein
VCKLLYSLLNALSLMLTTLTRPLYAVWGFPDPSKINSVKCIHTGYFLFAVSVLNTIIELFVALLPIPVVYNLKMGQQQRLSVISILCLGLLVFLAGCVRCVFVYKSLVATWDVTWWSGPQWICSEVENNLALVSLSFEYSR